MLVKNSDFHSNTWAKLSYFMQCYGRLEKRANYSAKTLQQNSEFDHHVHDVSLIMKWNQHASVIHNSIMPFPQCKKIIPMTFKIQRATEPLTTIGLLTSIEYLICCLSCRSYLIYHI